METHENKLEQVIYDINKEIALLRADKKKNIKFLERFLDEYQIEHGFDKLYEVLRQYIELGKRE